MGHPSPTLTSSPTNQMSKGEAIPTTRIPEYTKLLLIKRVMLPNLLMASRSARRYINKLNRVKLQAQEYKIVTRRFDQNEANFKFQGTSHQKDEDKTQESVQNSSSSSSNSRLIQNIQRYTKIPNWNFLVKRLIGCNYTISNK